MTFLSSQAVLFSGNGRCLTLTSISLRIPCALCTRRLDIVSVNTCLYILYTVQVCSMVRIGICIDRVTISPVDKVLTLIITLQDAIYAGKGKLIVLQSALIHYTLSTIA